MVSERQRGTLSDKKGLLFVGVVLVCFMQAGLYAGRRSSQKYLSPGEEQPVLDSFLPSFVSSQSTIHDHPIPELMAKAEKNFRDLLSRQSTSLKKAVAEYKRRYGKNPPKGFDEWWDFAMKNNVKIIDEYDGLMDDLAPFWNMSGGDFRLRADEAGRLPYIDVVRIRDGGSFAINYADDSETSDVSVRSKGFTWMIEKFQDKLPDMDFAVNTMAEGRVLVPWELRRDPNQIASYASQTGLESLYTPDWRGSGDVWEAYRRTCEPKTPARRQFSSLRAPSVNPGTNILPGALQPGDEFEFAASLNGNYPFCNNPWARYTQGHFFSDWRTIPIMFPIFSPAKAPGYSDIRVPSHYYYGTSRRHTYGWDEVNLVLKDIDRMETPWEKKNDKIFWRGATTGGGSSPPGFSPQYHRQRFVRMTSAKTKNTRRVVFADPPNSSNFISADVPIEALNNEVMDVAFVMAIDYHNYPGGLKAYMRDHRFDDGVYLGDHWRHKYLVDLDGMSYSGRFFAFLESDSAVIKSTVYREFHSDWIQPWLHFIPLSTSYQEIYNIHAFFSGAAPSALEAVNSTALSVPQERRRSIDGDRRLRRIARAGKQWRKTFGRKEDMEAYMYRLCLEYARLWSDDRESMSFTPP